MPLTPQHLQAIAHNGGNLQLIACAGSGKTEVVAQHITKLLMPIDQAGIKPMP
jgi:DNA helicase II / ATP-dependent DNA helicase PcrA